MLKTRGLNAINVKDANGDVDGEGVMGETGGKADGVELAGVIGEGEHLARQLARVRAKFGMDPAVARRSLEDAWISPTVMEEDEAEFIDAVADCLGAGLPLEAALTCWDTGELARDADEEEEETLDLSPPYTPHVATGRRLLVR